MSSSLQNQWIKNSPVVVLSDDDDLALVLYFSLVISILILAHSAYVNRNHKLRKIRVISDICALSIVCQVICYLVCLRGCSAESSTYLLNIISNVIAGSVAQLCDNYIVFSRYIFVYNAYSDDNKHVSILHKAVTCIVTFIVLYCSWIPFYTIAPLFVSMNDDIQAVEYSYYCITYVLFVSYVAYDILYTVLIMIKIKDVLHANTERGDRIATLKVLGAKAIIHNCFSIAAITLYCFWETYGVFVYNLVIVLAIHTIFNLKLEHYFYSGNEHNTWSAKILFIRSYSTHSKVRFIKNLESIKVKPLIVDTSSDVV